MIIVDLKVVFPFSIFSNYGAKEILPLPTKCRVWFLTFAIGNRLLSIELSLKEEKISSLHFSSWSQLKPLSSFRSLYPFKKKKKYRLTKWNERVSNISVIYDSIKNCLRGGRSGQGKKMKSILEGYYCLSDKA